MRKGNLLIELFGEEIPARMQRKALQDFSQFFVKEFDDLSLSHGDIKTYITPRRLAIIVTDLDLSQEDRIEERKGPHVDAPQQAIEGFLKSTGFSLEACEKRDMGKGTFYVAKIEKKGKPAAELLPSVVQKVIDSFPWSKSMRWGSSAKTWVRPLHSGMCLLDKETISFDISFGEDEKITFGNTTYGHRFMAGQPLQIHTVGEYAPLLKQHFVIVDQNERRQIILNKAIELAESKGLKLIQDNKLLDEVTGLVEWPVPLMGTVDSEFMNLPPECLITVMKSHQKYFALEAKDGALAPYFIIVANLEATDGGEAIIEGNERVLRARFADAAFFYEQDRRKTLQEHSNELGQLIFHAELGSMAAKAYRLDELSQYIAPKLNVDAQKASLAAVLCKADLITEMVREFPELQGIMGYYYASNEAPEVSHAILEHYGPKEGQAFFSNVSRVVALADKIDTLVGFFSIGIKPTSSKDPYALRRAALGVIRLLEENVPIRLEDLIQESIKAYGTKIEPKSDLTAELKSFFIDRLKVYWKDQGIRYDTLNAVLPKAENDTIYVLKQRAFALEAFIQGDDGEDLLAAYKRASNIVRIEEEKDQQSYQGSVTPSLFRQDQEKNLIQALEKTKEPLDMLMDNQNFEGAMHQLSKLRSLVDGFFDQVTVNDNDPEVRQNRLRLLSKIKSTLEQVADFSKIERGSNTISQK